MQFGFGDAFGTHEHRIGLFQGQRAFQQVSIECLAGLKYFSAPGKSRAPQIVVIKRLGVCRRGGDAILIDEWIERLR